MLCHCLSLWMESNSPDQTLCTDLPVCSYVQFVCMYLPTYLLTSLCVRGQEFKIEKGPNIKWLNGVPPSDEPPCGFDGTKCFSAGDSRQVNTDTPLQLSWGSPIPNLAAVSALGSVLDLFTRLSFAWILWDTYSLQVSCLFLILFAKSDDPVISLIPILRGIIPAPNTCPLTLAPLGGGGGKGYGFLFFANSSWSTVNFALKLAIPLRATIPHLVSKKLWPRS